MSQSKRNRSGAVACGHPDTAAAATEILADGGNAFDAALAALCAACIAEPVLASLGGGGFLLASPAHGKPVVYDFFCQTPASKQPLASLDFYPIRADFGTTAQEFHIGRASIAVPGVVAGLFAAHRDLGRLPIQRIVEPAVRLARNGVVLNEFQARVLQIVSPIYRASASARECFRPDTGEDRLPVNGERYSNPALAETLAALADQGESLFYQGAIAREIARHCADGGMLSQQDLASYQVEQRAPLRYRYRGAEILSNPLPSSGGPLIAFGLQLLEQLNHEPGQRNRLLAGVMAATGLARIEAGLDQPLHPDAQHLLDPDFLARHSEQLRNRARCLRGTTHISVIDADGSEASLTVSNGEGSGEMLGDTGIMLNNMLGEEDLNPQGFHRWATNTRLTSMMAPTILHLADGRRIALGSGGSNRIRTALLQVIDRLVNTGMSLQDAIRAPRIHVENQLLSIEPGMAEAELAGLRADWPEHHLWDQQSLFFGGVHAVQCDGGQLSGYGDLRRSGVFAHTA